jgi:hypothetical protein
LPTYSSTVPGVDLLSPSLRIIRSDEIVVSFVGKSFPADTL